jgi:ABC-type sugar transport system permease subunit
VSPDEGTERRGPDRQSADGSTDSRQRARRISSWIVLVVACILAMTSVLVVFVRDQALDTDTYVATVQPLASDPAVQSAVADAVSARLVASTNLKQQVTDALPPSAGFLATPISVGLKTVVQQTTLQFVQSDAFRRLWTTLNRAAHQQLVALLTGSAIGPVSTDRGQVRLDLGKVVARVQLLLDANGITVFDGVATGGSPQFILFQSTQLERLQSLIRTLDRLALLLPIVTVALLVAGVLLPVDRRRGFVRAAIGLSVAMAALVAAFAVGRHQYLGVMSGATPHNAAAAAYDIVTGVPLETVRTTLGLSVVAALVGMAMGSRSIRARARAAWPPRRRADGQLRRLSSTYGRQIALALFGIGMSVLAIWDNVAVGLPILVVAGVLALVDRRRSAPDAGVGVTTTGLRPDRAPHSPAPP